MRVSFRLAGYSSEEEKVSLTEFRLIGTFMRITVIKKTTSSWHPGSWKI